MKTFNSKQVAIMVGALVESKLCYRCGKKMKMQIDPITKKKSKYIWRCECMPKNVILSLG